MVFNDAARKLIAAIGENINVAMHDWWAYMVVSGCGGRVFYDSYPSVRYRQHENNLVGSNTTWRTRLIRIRMLYQGRFKAWNDTNVNALQQINHMLTPCNRKVLEDFSRVRKCSFTPRLIGLKKSGIYRQTLLGNIGLIVAAIFNKI
jgi:hypothetical protein